MQEQTQAQASATAGWWQGDQKRVRAAAETGGRRWTTTMARSTKQAARRPIHRQGPRSCAEEPLHEQRRGTRQRLREASPLSCGCWRRERESSLTHTEQKAEDANERTRVSEGSDRGARAEPAAAWTARPHALARATIARALSIRLLAPRCPLRSARGGSSALTFKRGRSGGAGAKKTHRGRGEKQRRGRRRRGGTQQGLSKARPYTIHEDQKRTNKHTLTSH